MTIERILIMAVKRPKMTENHFISSIKELKSLGHTAGGTIIEVVTQSRDHIHPATYIGQGKATEIKHLIEEMNITLAISNDELSPGQLRNLTDIFDIRVIDRSQLILDIFARRAKTREGQLQVELAQLEYMLPRLHGMGTILSRLGGGIGTRGPGETKLETDQRHIRRRIDDIKKSLRTVVKQREQYRKRRRLNQVFQIAIVGYTNAGKSTLFNRLTKESSLEENLLFATLDPLTRKLKLPSGFECLITDTVGFLQDLPTSLIAAFRSTLEEVAEANFIIHVVDSSHPDQVQHQKTVLSILEDLEAHTIPQLTVYNKEDQINDNFVPLHHPHILMSAYSELDIKQLITMIEKLLKQNWEAYSFIIKPDEGRLLNELERETIISHRKFNEAINGYEISGYIDKEHALYHALFNRDDSEYDKG